MRKLSEPKVYFIIVCWNNRDLLEECFDTIRNQTYKNYETICVDNGSTDDSVDYIKKNHQDVLLIENGKNDGFAIGNNIGIKKALEDKDCQYVALLNSDARLGPDWLHELVKHATKHPKGAGFQSPTVDYYDHETLDSYGITIDHQGRARQLGYRVAVSKLKTKQVFGVNAAACLYARSFLDEQPFGEDYFDSDLWMYLEDVDLAARAVITGWENWFVAKSLAYHMGSASSGKNPGFSVYMIYRNNLLLLVKNLPFVLLLRVLPGVIVTDLITLVSLFRGKNYPTIKAIIKGRLYSLPLIPLFFNKHRVLNKYRQVSTKSLNEIMRQK